MKAMQPKIAVAISTFRLSYFEWVATLLRSLQNQTLTPAEVIVVVNESKRYYEKLSEFAKSKIHEERLDVNIILNPIEKGIAHSRNIALRSTRSPYIAYTDDDAFPDRCWLEELAFALGSSEKVAAATGPVELRCEPGAQNIASSFPRELYWVVGCTSLNSPQIIRVRNGFGSNLALKRDVALQYGGFNEAFGYGKRELMVGEEPEFGAKLAQANYVTLWNPKAIVYHRVSRERLRTKNIVTRSFVEGKTKAVLVRSYGTSILEPEKYYMKSLVQRLIRSQSFRSSMLILLSTIAVFTGYVAHRALSLSPNF
jgi:glycosyltransferase involved in cell wall biosynthesis